MRGGQFFFILLSFAALLLAAGCYSVVADDLYSLPKASDRYLKLQQRIDEVRDSGAEYAPPTGGTQRQPVHFTDIDGDGTSEAVAFFIARAEDNPLKIYIFKLEGDDYIVADIIEGMGTGVDSVRYVDMDGDNTQEFIVGWQISSAVRHVSLYSLRSFQNTKLADADYSTLSVFDVTDDGLPDLVTIRVATADSPGLMEVFSLMPDGEVVSSTADMSEGVESVSRLLIGRLLDGTPAVTLDVRTPDGIVTDVFCVADGSLRNLMRVLDSPPAPRVREDWSNDINGDGIIEVPFPTALPQQTETTVYYSVDWYAYYSGGARRVVMSTYHNYYDHWYLELPQSWIGHISVRREDLVAGERAVVFSYVDETAPERFVDFLRIYMLTGDNRFERARLTGRFTLSDDVDQTIYAASLVNPEENVPFMPTRELISSAFGIIYTDWLAGS